MPIFHVELDEQDLIAIIKKKLEEMTGQEFSEKYLSIEVKTKSNWKAEWEKGKFKAVYKSISSF